MVIVERICLGIAGLALLATAAGAQGSPSAYDCHARIAASDAAPAIAPGEANPWQCPAGTAKLSSATLWQRHALEYCRLTTSVYDAALAAAKRLARARHYKRNSWVVEMDGDETVLDNSLYEAERDKCGNPAFAPAVWESWIHARATPQSNPGMAADVPGAAAFTQSIHRMGGLVAIVTNRDVADDAITRDNLRRIGIWFDFEIGQDASKPTDKKDKLQRWKDAASALGRRFHTRARAVMWLGDQVTDLALTDAKGEMTGAMSQGDAGRGIGVDRFILPNAMYGNWSP